MKGISAAALTLFLLAVCAGGGEDLSVDPPASGQEPGAVLGFSDLPPEEVFAALPEYLICSSGAGGWSTELSVQPDGTFSGSYLDTDMGDAGENYPCGTRYVCGFSGTFGQPEQMAECVYSTSVEELVLEDVPGEVSYGDGFRYVGAEPAGMGNANEFLILFPGVRLSELPEGVVQWISISRGEDAQNLGEFMDCYGLYNVDREAAFLS